MKKYILFLFGLLPFIFAGCEEIKGEINELKTEIDELKQANQIMQQQLDQLNNDVSNIQTIIAAIQSGAYIKSVMPLLEEGEQVGYIFSLSNGKTFTVRNGKDGKDGDTPNISVYRDEHGNFWWTLNGEIITDKNGNKVKADGIVPKFEIIDGYWNVSFDNGQTWIELGPANGEDGEDGLDGDQLFSRIEYVEGGNVVKFILSDQTVLTLPCYQAISISFDVPDNTAGISAGETIKVNYSLSYGDSRTVVTASTDGNYIVKVIKNSDISGTILITCPGLYMDGYVNVMAFDGVGYSSVAVIRFFEKQIIFDSGLDFHVGTDAGKIYVPFRYNFEYYVEVDRAASDWITLEKTKSEFLSGQIIANYSQNNGSQRSGVIYIYPTNTAGNPYAKITITQQAAYFYLDTHSLLFSSDGGEKSIEYTSSRKTRAEQSSDWVSCSLQKEGAHYNKLKVTTKKNLTEKKRTDKVVIFAEDDGSKLATIDIIQMAEGGEEEMDLVFEVRINESNDYTAYLPVGRLGDSDFIVSWGDGQYQKVDYEYNLPYTFHQYDNTQGPKTYEIRISGTVSEINSNYIDEGKRSSIVAIKQWGNIGLRNISCGFNGNTNLSSIAPDESYCFSNIHSFDETFASCPRLKSIPKGLFQNAKNATYFNNTFRYCRSLESVPDRLFADCSSAVYFQSTFEECTSLKNIPGNIFEGCCNAQYITNTFRSCKKITSIPHGLFNDTNNVESFDCVFIYCENLESFPDDIFSKTEKVKIFNHVFDGTKITNIPEGLFRNCPNASSFEGTFNYCISLKTIPAGLFDNNRKVTNFSNTFGWCYNIIGETPYTTINGKKVHLYERINFPDYFVTPIRNESCFSEDRTLTDYENIPSTWGGPEHN